MRVLVVSNMLADASHPERGRFVRDQVAALRELAREDGAGGVAAAEDGAGGEVTAEDGAGGEVTAEDGAGGLPAADGDGGCAAVVDGRAQRERLGIELYEFPPGPRALVDATRELRTRYGERRGAGRFDVVHAHYGLSAWPALAVGARIRGLTVHGTDVRHPRTRQVTRAVLPLMDLVAAPSPELAGELPGAAARRRALVLPCGVDMRRFRPLPRARARAELGLDPERPCVLFPADPARPEKRFDRAQALVGALASPPRLLTLGGVEPERVPLWINAANAVLVTSEREGFGLAVLEALACDVPVLATPVGVHRQALEDLAGTLCEPFSPVPWRAALEPHLQTPDPRVEGRQRADRLSSIRMAAALAQAWRSALDEHRGGRGG